MNETTDRPAATRTTRRRDDATTESRPTARPTSNDRLTTIGFFHEFARVVSRARS